jgi:undecaprenyl-diphosphatase
VATVLAWVLLRSGARREAAALLLAAGTAEVVAFALLYTVRRAHPALWEVLVHLHRYSFPSAHALVATATYGMASYLVGHLRPAIKRATHLGAGLLILVVGVSRVALGANWPTDVLGGFAGGLLILWLTIYWYEGNYTVILQGLSLLSRQGPEGKKLPEAGSRAADGEE